MLVAADCASLIALATCEQLPLLDTLSSPVQVPRAVLAGAVIAGRPQAGLLAAYLQPRSVKVDMSRQLLATGSLGQGEREALALALESGDALLLADDPRLRRTARLNGLPLIGCLGVLLRGKQTGRLIRVKPLLDRLRAARLGIAESLLDQALILAEES